MEVNGQLYSLNVIHPGKTTISIGQEAGCDPEPFWALPRREKSLISAGNRTLKPFLYQVSYSRFFIDVAQMKKIRVGLL
jgi:hypothetical protein